MKFRPTLKRIKFGGMAAIELRTARLRVIALTAKGPRIAYWGRPDGDNLLLWAPGKYRRGQWDLMGGHRLWGLPARRRRGGGNLRRRQPAVHRRGLRPRIHRDRPG